MDSELLEDARRLRSGANDATLLDEALSALIALNRAGEIDAAYAAYDQFPVDQADEWGSLGAFRGRVAAS